jgi:hypothetical protein
MLATIQSRVLSSHLLSGNVKVKLYKTIILQVVLYGCETWSLTLRDKHRMRVFENRVLRRILGPKSDEVTGEWRKLPSEELHILFSFPNIIRHIKSRRMRWAEHVAWMGEESVQGFGGEPNGRIPLGRPRHTCEDGMKMDLKEIGCGGVVCGCGGVGCGCVE